MPVSYKDKFKKLQEEYDELEKLLQDSNKLKEQYRSDRSSIDSELYKTKKKLKEVTDELSDTNGKLQRALGYIDRVNEGKTGGLSKDIYGNFSEAALGPNV